jgi:Protein of unknown function (DUF2802)/Family of unknown function (DUF6115)
MNMENPILWMTIVEGAAIVILSLSILWMLWAKRTGKWAAGEVADGQAAELPIEELRQLMEESQVITQDLAGNLKEKKMISQQLLEQLDEKINKLTWLLGRVEEVSDRPRPTENTTNIYVKAIELAENGLSLPEIEQQLHLAKGEVQLLLDLKAYCLK